MDSGKHSPIEKGLLESSFDFVHDFKFSKSDILYKLLNDNLIKAYIRNKRLTKLDITDPEFGFTSFKVLGDYFGEQMMPLMVELEELIRMTLVKSAGTSSKVIASNKIKEEIVFHVTALLERSLIQYLFSEDYKVIPSKNMLRVNLCRWILISEFLKPEDKLQSVILFKGSLSGMMK